MNDGVCVVWCGHHAVGRGEPGLVEKLWFWSNHYNAAQSMNDTTARRLEWKGSSERMGPEHCRDETQQMVGVGRWQRATGLDGVVMRLECCFDWGNLFCLFISITTLRTLEENTRCFIDRAHLDSPISHLVERTVGAWLFHGCAARCGVSILIFQLGLVVVIFDLCLDIGISCKSCGIEGVIAVTALDFVVHIWEAQNCGALWAE